MTLLGVPEAVSIPAGLLDQDGSRRSFGDKGEGAVCIDGDDNGNNVSHIVFGSLVELLGKSHDVDAVLTERQVPPGGAGVALPPGICSLI